jgi:hypothetical protein
MISSNDVNPRRKRNCVPMIAGLSLALTLFSVSATAIAQNPESKPAETKPAGSYEAFFLANVTQQNEFNDVQTDLRNMLPKSKIFGMPSQHAISIWGPPEDLALAQKMITELDHAKKVYRLIYTIKETERGKPVGSRSVALVAVSGERTQMKQGTRRANCFILPAVSPWRSPPRGRQTASSGVASASSSSIWKYVRIMR